MSRDMLFGTQELSEEEKEEIKAANTRREEVGVRSWAVEQIVSVCDKVSNLDGLAAEIIAEADQLAQYLNTGKIPNSEDDDE